MRLGSNQGNGCLEQSTTGAEDQEHAGGYHTGSGFSPESRPGGCRLPLWQREKTQLDLVQVLLPPRQRSRYASKPGGPGSAGASTKSPVINALDLVVRKQNQQGRWLLERTYKELADSQGKKVYYWYHNSLRLYITSSELADIQEQKGQSSKWVTLRALRVLKAAFPDVRS